jgi:hypothetical protein
VREISRCQIFRWNNAKIPLQRSHYRDSKRNVATRSRRNVKSRMAALNFECVERFTQSCPRESDANGDEGRGQGVKKWRISTVRCRRLRSRPNYVIKWLVERFAYWSVPRVHIAISIRPPAHSHPPAIALHIPTRPILRRFRESCHRSAAFYSHR